MATERSSQWDKFSEEGRNVFELAEGARKRYRHPYIGTEHILLGLTSLPSEEPVVEFLKKHGINNERMSKVVEYVVGRGTSTESEGSTASSDRIIELAHAEARIDSSQTTPFHILRAIVNHGEGLAAGILDLTGVNKNTFENTKSAQNPEPPKPEIVQRIEAFYENPAISDDVKSKMASFIKILVDRAEESPDLF